MKTAINILSLVQAYSSIEGEKFTNFLNHYDIEVKPQELIGLSELVGILYPLGGNYVFDSFYVGYKIPQIGKEFDLLRIGGNYIVNVELKSFGAGDKIKQQLNRNRHYLASLGKQIYSFTFVSDEKKLYFLIDTLSSYSRVKRNYLCIWY